MNDYAKRTQYEPNTNPNEPNLETTLIGISQAGAQDGGRQRTEVRKSEIRISSTDYQVRQYNFCFLGGLCGRVSRISLIVSRTNEESPATRAGL